MKSPRKLNYPALGLPTAPETAVFRAVCQALRTDPRLSAAVNTFLCWEGTEGDTWEPSFSTAPYLRVSPFPTSAGWVTEKQHSSPVTVHVETATKGTNFDDCGNLWGLVRAAIFPQNDPARRDAVITLLQTAGVTKPTIKLNAFGVVADDVNQVILVARGSIEFGSLVMT